MWRDHLYLNWKKFWRSKNLGVGLITRILTVFSLLYIAASLLGLGFVFDDIAEEIDLGDSYQLLTKCFLYYLLIDLFLRVMIMKIPFDRFESLILQPVTKRSIINSVIGTSLINGFNILPLFFLIPVSIDVVYPIDGLGLMLGWLISMIGALVVVHFIAMRLKSLLNTYVWLYLLLAVLIGAMIYIDYQQVWEWSAIKHRIAWTMAFPALLTAVIIWLMAFLLYRWNTRVMHGQAYLAASYRPTSKGWYAASFEQLDFLGASGEALREQLKLILRNKRLRTQLIFSVLLLPVGYIFFFTDAYEGDGWKLFWGFYFMGLLPMNLAPYLWAHRADHISMLHTMPLSVRDYVGRQYIAYLFLTLVTAIPSCLYLVMDIGLAKYFGTAWLYMAGILIPSLMLAAVFNRVPMEINTSGTFNYQGISMQQIVVVLIVLTIPVTLFLAFSVWGRSHMGLLCIAILGVIGILCAPLWLRWISNWSVAEKYTLYDAYRQQK